MQTRQNALCWNPMEPFHFTTASEDHDLYTFDMRRLDHAICVHKVHSAHHSHSSAHASKQPRTRSVCAPRTSLLHVRVQGHVSAVLDVDYSPTGRQFVSGSYDKTLRLWEASKPKATQVYHTKRMQRLFSVVWSADDAYVLSGSDDTNVRLWRSSPNARATQPNPRQKRKREYEEALVERHKHLPQVKRIKEHVHLPKAIKKAAEVKETVLGTREKREKNRRAHSRPGSVPKISAKKKKVWAVSE